MKYKLIEEETTYQALSSEESSFYGQKLTTAVDLSFHKRHSVNLLVGLSLTIKALSSKETVCELQIAYMYHVKFKGLIDLKAILMALKDAFKAFTDSFEVFTIGHHLQGIPVEEPDYDEVIENAKEKMFCMLN